MSHQQIYSGDDSALNTRQSFRRRMTWDRKLPDDVVTALWESPDAVLRRGECLQTKTRTSVARVDFPSGSYLLKFHHWAGFWKTLSKSRATSPNHRSFCDGLKLVEHGVPTPRPLACVDVRVGPLNVCSYLLTEFVSGTSLYRKMRFGKPDGAAADHLAHQVADIWQLLDDIHYSHNDLKPENFMIDRDDRVWLIDLENARWHRDRQSLRRSQVEDAKRLFHVRNWQAAPQAAEKFRQRLWATLAVQAAIGQGEDPPHPLARSLEIGDERAMGVSVLIPCLNAVEDIRGCIEAVRDFADEILVADASSNDQTCEVVQSLADCRVIRFDVFDVDMRRRAIADASQPWVLVVEPGERVSPDLAKEIQFLLANRPDCDGYRIERRNYFLGRPVRFGDWAGNRPVRLVRRDGPVLPEFAGLDGENSPERIGRLRNRLILDRVRTIEQYVAALAQDAAEAAEQMQASGRRAPLARVLFHPPLTFIRSYFGMLGCLDGSAGLHLAILSALSAYIKYARLWQMQHALPFPDSQVTETPGLKLLDLEDDATAEARPSVPDAASLSRRRAA